MGRWWSLTPWLSFPPRRYEQPKCDHTARAHPIKARDLYKGRQLPGRRRRGGGAGWGRCFRARGPLSGQRPRSGSGSSLVAAPRGPRSAVSVAPTVGPCLGSRACRRVGGGASEASTSEDTRCPRLGTRPGSPQRSARDPARSQAGACAPAPDVPAELLGEKLPFRFQGLELHLGGRRVPQQGLRHGAEAEGSPSGLFKHTHGRLCTRPAPSVCGRRAARAAETTASGHRPERKGKARAVQATPAAVPPLGPPGRSRAAETVSAARGESHGIGEAVKAPHQSVSFRASSFPLSDPRLCTLGHSSETMSIVRDVFAAGCAFAPGLTRGLVNAGSEQLRGPHIIRPAVGTGGSELQDAKTSSADKGGGGRLPAERLVGGLCVFLCSRAAAFGTRTGLRGRGAGSEGPGTATSLLPAGPAQRPRCARPSPAQAFAGSLPRVPSIPVRGRFAGSYFHCTVFLCVIHESGCSLPLGGGRCRRGRGDGRGGRGRGKGGS